MVSQQHALFGIVAWIGMLVAWLIERVRMQPLVLTQKQSWSQSTVNDNMLTQHTLGPAADGIHVRSRKPSNPMTCTFDSRHAKCSNDGYQAVATVMMDCMGTQA